MVKHSRSLAIGLLCACGPLLIQGCAGVVLAGAATGAMVATDPRTAGTMVDDQMIEFKIREAFYQDSELSKQSHLSVTSYNNIVLLTGETINEPLRQRIEALARNAPKVRQVHNEIIIAAPSSMLARSNDSLITAKVRSRLAATREVKSRDIKVVTENGTVFLMGLVTREQADQATKVVRQTAGVQRVVRLFEYLG